MSVDVPALIAENLRMRDFLLALAAECMRCGGSGTVNVRYGGDGYGGRCAAEADGEKPCPECADVRAALR